jgi:hypothetical protein
MSALIFRIKPKKKLIFFHGKAVGEFSSSTARNDFLVAAFCLFYHYLFKVAHI